MTTRAFGDVSRLDVAGRLEELLPAHPAWLRQVHGAAIIDADMDKRSRPQADGAVARENGVCVVMAADCMPVLLADEKGAVVAAAHAGWRGLCAGVLEGAVEAMRVPAPQLLAWLGPAIGPRAYEVGAEVRDAFLARSREAEKAFAPSVRAEHWLLDLYAIARQRLAATGVTRIYGGGYCTLTDKERFFSYRRDRVSERMAAAIWLE